MNRIEEDVRVVSESLCKTAPNTVVAMLQADRATEELLIERITAQSKGKTLIFITHRQEVAQRCDHIIELQKQ